MTVEITSWSISTKVWYRTGIELATPGSAVRHASVARHVTDCATWPNEFWRIDFWLRGLNILWLWPLVVDSDIWKKSSIGMSSMPLVILKTCIKSARLRLYSSVGKFNSCSLSLYDKCLRVESILVALLCTFSIIRICFLSTGNQIKSPKFRCDLTNDLYRHKKYFYP